jgi:hypothetical protein
MIAGNAQTTVVSYAPDLCDLIAILQEPRHAAHLESQFTESTAPSSSARTVFISVGIVCNGILL